MEGNGKIYLEGEKTDIVAVTEDDGWRQCQIHAERKVKISKEKENMNTGRTVQFAQGQKSH